MITLGTGPTGPAGPHPGPTHPGPSHPPQPAPYPPRMTGPGDGRPEPWPTPTPNPIPVPFRDTYIGKPMGWQDGSPVFGDAPRSPTGVLALASPG